MSEREEDIMLLGTYQRERNLPEGLPLAIDLINADQIK